mgnify:CR=1 FL=1
MTKPKEQTTLQAYKACIIDIDSISRDSFSKIASIANLSKTCLELKHKESIEDVMNALSTICYIADTTADCVNYSAEVATCDDMGE